MTDLRETVFGIVARACRNFRPAPDSNLEADIVGAATDAIMSEIAKARVMVKPLEWDGQTIGEEVCAASPYRGPRYSVLPSCRDGFIARTASNGYFDGMRAHETLEAAKSACQADYERRIMDAVEIVSEPAIAPHQSQAIRDAIDALRVAADKARQSEASDRKWEGEYDLLTHHAEMLERVLMNTQAAPQETQGAECTPGATQAALVVTDAMVAIGGERIVKCAEDMPETGLSLEARGEMFARAALAAALPLAKTEAQVRAEWTEKLAKLLEHEEVARGQGETEPLADIIRSQAGGGE